MPKTAKKRAVKKVATVLKKKKKLPTAELVAREIAKREKIFKAANNAEKRVLIAKDVIAQIKAKKIKPAIGTFVSFLNEDNILSPEQVAHWPGTISADADARKLLLTNKINQCKCCALGGMFVSCTLYNNNTTARELKYSDWSIPSWLDQSTMGDTIDDDQYVIKNGLNKFFSLAQLRLIEQTFEGNMGAVRSGETDNNEKAYQKFTKAQQEFFDKHLKPADRLLAIMRNIVRNKGTFKP